MSRAATILLLYLAVGFVTMLLWRRAHDGTLAALLLWPFFVPALLPANEAFAQEEEVPVGPACEELAQALATLGPDHSGHCGPTLAAVGRKLRALEERIAEVDRLLERWAEQPATPARQLTAERLGAFRAQAQEELDTGLSNLTELTARVHLARLTGEDAASLGVQLSRLAADIDSATEVAQLGVPGRG